MTPDSASSPEHVRETAGAPETASDADAWRAKDQHWRELRMVPRQLGWALVALSLGIAPRKAALDAVPEPVKEIYALRLTALKRSASPSSSKGMLQYETEVQARTKNPAKDDRPVNRYFDLVGFVDFLLRIKDGEVIDHHLLEVGEFWRRERLPDGARAPASADDAESQQAAATATQPVPVSTPVPIQVVDAEDGGSRYDGVVPGLLVMYLMSLAGKKEPPPPSLLKGDLKTLNFSALASKLEEFSGARVDGGGGDKPSTLRRALAKELEKASQFFFGIKPT